MLYAEWKADVNSLNEGFESSPVEKAAKKRQIDSRYTTRFLQLAKEHADDDVWLDCLIWISVEGIPGADFDAMFDQLGTNAATIRNTVQLELLMSEFISLQSDRIDPALTTISEKHPEFSVRGAALYALAARRKCRAEEQGDEHELGLATKLLARVVADYPQVKTYRGKNVDNATALLEDLRGPVAINKMAPETTGETISGDKFGLNEAIRGKVAVISFSGHWCNPCVAMHAVQKEIVSKFPKESVVVVEINSDAPGSLEKVRTKIVADGLDWTVVTDGSRGPISEQWRVTTWPTYFVLDTKGRIRHRGTGNVGQRLITWVEKVVSENE